MNPQRIYLQRFLGDAMPLIPLSGLYFLYLGFTISQISELFLLYAISVAVLEIPTGYIADHTSHRGAMIFSKIIKFTAFVPWVFFPSHLWITVGYLLWAFASALESGAFQSYLADTIPNKDFEKIYGRSLTVSLVAFVLGSLSYLLVPVIGFKAIGLVGLCMLLGAVLVSFTLPKVREHATQEKRLLLTKISFKKIFAPSSATLIILILVGAFAAGIKGTLDEYSGLLLNSTTAVIGVGLAMGFLEFVKASATGFAHRISLTTSAQKYVLLFLAFIFIIIGNLPFYFVLPLLTLALLADGVLWVHNDAAIQRNAPRNLRATITSIRSLAGEIVSITFLGVVTFGPFKELGYIYLTGGIVLILGFILTILTKYILEKRG